MLVTFIVNLLRLHRNVLLCTPSLLDVSDCSLEMNSECTEMIRYGHWFSVNFYRTFVFHTVICLWYIFVFLLLFSPSKSVWTIGQNFMSSIPLVKFINCQPYTNMVIMRTSNTGMTLASLNLAMWNFYVVQVANAHAMNRYRRMEL